MVMATAVTEDKDSMQSFIDGEAIKITELLMPWIAILLSLIIALWLKDFAQNFMIGLKR